jgi:Ni,Fe-hydrogenase I small subunit
LQAAGELGLRFTPTAIRCAVRSCSLSKVIWLHEEQRCELSESLLAAAAEAGSVEIMQWLVEKHVALNPHTTAMAAAKGGAVQVFQWLQ